MNTQTTHNTVLQCRQGWTGRLYGNKLSDSDRILLVFSVNSLTGHSTFHEVMPLRTSTDVKIQVLDHSHELFIPASLYLLVFGAMVNS